MRLIVGSTNPVKVGAVRSMALRYWQNCTVNGVEVSSGVSHQPRSDEETRRGATNRAQAALATDPAADLGVGIEGGVQDTDGRLFELAWVCAIDRPGRVYYGGSGRFELPQVVANKIRAGGELGPVMDGLTGVTEVKKKGGAVSFMTKDVVTRSLLYEPAVTFALAPYANPEWYK